MEGEIILKVHESYRTVISICDKELLGKLLEEGEKQLDLTGDFFSGDLVGIQEAKESMIDWAKEDATFNIVGKKSVSLALEIGLIKKEGILSVSGVPFALVLL